MVQRVFRHAFAICLTRAYLVPALAFSAGTGLLVRLALSPNVPRPVDAHVLIAAVTRFGVGLLISILAVWPAASLLSLAIGIGRQESVSLRDRWIPFGMYLRVLVVEAVIGALTALGLICLLVPGLFAMVVWSPTLALIVDGRAQFFDAMDRSLDLTDGSRGDVFATLLCVFIVGSVGFGLSLSSQSAFGAASWPGMLVSVLFMTPVVAFGTAARAAIYLELRARRKPLTHSEFYLAPATTDPAH